MSAVAKKRSAAAAECANRSAKTRAAIEKQPRTGQRPPPLPTMPDSDEEMTRLADGYEVEWQDFIRRLADLAEFDTAIIKESLRRRILRAEHEIAPPQHDSVRPLELADLIRYDADYDMPGVDSCEIWSKYDARCAGCNKMAESWLKWDSRRYGDAEPRWRRRGTRQFVCWRCYEKVEQGALTELPFHK